MSNAGSTGRTEALHDRVAHLERRLDILHQIQGEALRERTARSMQSIGVVVDYLAANGLVDRDVITLHIERNFQITDSYADGDLPMAAIDVYGWLRWSSAIRELDNRGRPPWAELASVFPSELRRGWGGVEPDIEVGPPRDMDMQAEARK